jgi:hypothetical protein
MFCFRELIVRQKESLEVEVIPRAGKKKEIRLIQQAAQHELAAPKSDLLHKSQELPKANLWLMHSALTKYWDQR